jgi:hypothetical protein
MPSQKQTSNTSEKFRQNEKKLREVTGQRDTLRTWMFAILVRYGKVEIKNNDMNSVSNPAEWIDPVFTDEGITLKLKEPSDGE